MSENDSDRMGGTGEGASSLSLITIADHPSLQERAYQTLRSAILEGHLAVGERIYESKIAEQLGISRNPVRESVRRLQQDGLLDVRPRGGIFVASISIEEADDIYRVRGALEALAARLAAERITPDELEHLHTLVHEDEHDHVEGGAAVTEADQFHRAVHQYAHSTQLLEPLELLYGRILHYRNVTLALPGRANVAEAGHFEIYQAIARRDGARAELVMREHIEGARISLMRHLEHVVVADDVEESAPRARKA
ncbi:GntR family transcriptional regulator [Nocardioides sp. YIM 152315]|uniref:GntR family transcriptional regulator n=1 Tax=Nocardioides sp. YIM 152315 TaxID=3031760 RepID=UPI0023DB7BF7|nr:GntR family transcriptional regulator [Nocardioides sp. YIM 152315]MDF1605818.1 GntR family transcriptional regulator [Nocardioides sp. YIM 152315]